MQIRKRIAATLVAALVGSQALAAPVTLPQTLSNSFGSTGWNITSTGGTDSGLPFTGQCNSSPGVTVQDANGPTGAGDAFDNAWNVWVNGTGVAQTTGDLTGSTLTLDPVAISGLNVTVQYYAVPGIALLRTLVTLQNPTGSAIAAQVDVPVNFGSDSGSIIQATSSGDTTVTTADRWVISSDGGPSDPVNTTVMYNGAATITPAAYTQTVFNCAATNGLGATFNLSIPAGQSLSLIFFAGLGGINVSDNTIASAQSAAAAIFDTPTGLTNVGGFAGLTAQQSTTLANWGPVVLPPPSVPTPVPTLAEWSLVLLSVLLAGFGAVFLRRRRNGPQVFRS